MFRRFLLCILASSVGSATCFAEAYHTGFEAPAFTAGQLLSGQGGWTNILGPAAATIGMQGNGSPQSLTVTGGLSVLFAGLYQSVNSAPLGKHGSTTAFASVDAWEQGPLLTHFDDGANDLASGNLAIGIGAYTAQCWVSSDGYYYVQDIDAAVGYYKSFPISNPSGYNTIGAGIKIVGSVALIYYTLNGAVVDTMLTGPNNTLGTDYGLVGYLAAPDFTGFSHSDYNIQFDNFSWKSDRDLAGGPPPKP